MGIQIIKLASGAADVSGDSTATTPNMVNGIIRAIELVFEAGSDAGMDTYITEEGATTDQAIVALIGSATSVWLYPYNYAMDTAGADLTYDGTNEIAVPIITNNNLLFTKRCAVVHGNIFSREGH